MSKRPVTPRDLTFARSLVDAAAVTLHDTDHPAFEQLNKLRHELDEEAKKLGFTTMHDQHHSMIVSELIVTLGRNPPRRRIA